MPTLSAEKLSSLIRFLETFQSSPPCNILHVSLKPLSINPKSEVGELLVLLSLAKLGGQVGQAVLAKAAGIHEALVYYWLHFLVKRGWVSLSEDGELTQCEVTLTKEGRDFISALC
jgi:hypothetical protein